MINILNCNVTLPLLLAFDRGDLLLLLLLSGLDVEIDALETGCVLRHDEGLLVDPLLLGLDHLLLVLDLARLLSLLLLPLVVLDPVSLADPGDLGRGVPEAVALGDVTQVELLEAEDVADVLGIRSVGADVRNVCLEVKQSANSFGLCRCTIFRAWLDRWCSVSSCATVSSILICRSVAASSSDLGGLPVLGETSSVLLKSFSSTCCTVISMRTMLSPSRLFTNSASLGRRKIREDPLAPMRAVRPTLWT